MRVTGGMEGTVEVLGLGGMGGAYDQCREQSALVL